MTSQQQRLIAELSSEFLGPGEHASFEAALREVLQTQRASAARLVRETRRFTFEVVVETDRATAEREDITRAFTYEIKRFGFDSVEVRPTKEESLRPGVRVVEWLRDSVDVRERGRG